MCSIAFFLAGNKEEGRIRMIGYASAKAAEVTWMMLDVFSSLGMFRMIRGQRGKGHSYDLRISLMVGSSNSGTRLLILYG